MSIQATPKTDSSVADETAVRALYQELMDGWNRGSGDAFAAPFAEDGHLVGFDGTHLEGRREIASFHQPLFDKWLRGSRLVGQVESVRFLAPDVALMHAIGGTIMRGKAAPSPARDTIQTLVASRTGGQWKLAALPEHQASPDGRELRSRAAVELHRLVVEARTPERETRGPL